MSARGPVLVVDDDHDVRETLSEVLQQCGFVVEVASDGLEALALLEAGLSPKVILLDLMMPRMDGPELRERLLLDERFAHVPVIVLTADRRGAEQAEPSAAAALSKPVELDALLVTLGRFC